YLRKIDGEKQQKRLGLIKDDCETDSSFHASLRFEFCLNKILTDYLHGSPLKGALYGVGDGQSAFLYFCNPAYRPGLRFRL
ncbi:MAG: hypothetical protein ABJB34_09990, partial [Acidobacteriota bacterium]